MSIGKMCQLLEIPLRSWKFNNGMSFEDAQNFLIEFKEKVKKQRKELAKKYHPDKTGGDDARIKEINNVVDLVMKLEIKKQVQRPVNIRVYTTSTWSSYSYYSRY